MFKKKEEKIAGQNAGLQAVMEKRTEAVETRYAAIEEMSDPAEKILALQDFSQEANDAKKILRAIEEAIVRKRAGRSPLTYAKRAMLTTLSLPLLTITFTSEADWTAVGSQRKERKKFRAAVGIEALMEKIDRRQDDAARLLEQTVQHSNLAALADSPHFSRAYKQHEPLRDRFEAAAAARAALGGKAASPQEQQQKKPAAKKPVARPAAEPPVYLKKEI